jgi:hypothetical protein
LEYDSFGIGKYALSAYLEPTDGETDLNDNLHIDGIIQIVPPVHNIAIGNVKVPKTVVGQGYGLPIEVMVVNKGDFEENFCLTVYANQTLIEAREIKIESESSLNVTFAWNTTNFAKGNYTISAYASPVQGETELTDNSLFDGWIIVAMPGDITGKDIWPDGKVDMRDIGSVCRLFSVTAANPRYNPNYDIVYDGKIDLRDIGIACRNFGKVDP